MIMFNRYFQQELNYLREIGSEFSKAHPAISPMLKGPGADPDVERLLEGVAFLTALLRQKLDDEFPEITHDLMQLIWPHYLRPIPATAMISFAPNPTLRQSVKIPSGIQLASVPVARTTGTTGTTCIFSTSYEVEIHPLDLIDAVLVQPSGQPPAIKLNLKLNNLKVLDWQPQSLRFFIAGDYANAADIYLLLNYYLKRIIISTPGKGTPCVLSREFLKPVGFSDKEALIPYPSHSFPGFRILQEYLVSPEKFLFIDLSGLEHWRNRGDSSSFEISFELNDFHFSPPRIKKENFVLFASPAINLFPHDADPISLTHRDTQYLIRPSGSSDGNYQIYSVDKVTGFVHGTARERKFEPFNCFNPDPQSAPVYHTTLRDSPIRSGYDTYLSVTYPPGAEPPVPETLSINLMCTNGSLPDMLQAGDISLPTSSSPEFAEFKNIQTPTPNILPPLERRPLLEKNKNKSEETYRNKSEETKLLWRLLSHLSLNYLSLTKTENLRAILDLYIFPGSRDQTAVIANRKRISGIESIEARQSDRLVSGILMRGQEINLKVNQGNFASEGDMFLFGSVLDNFMGSYASVNSYTRIAFKDTLKGNIYQWKARLGNHILI